MLPSKGGLHEPIGMEAAGQQQSRFVARSRPLTRRYIGRFCLMTPDVARDALSMEHRQLYFGDKDDEYK